MDDTRRKEEAAGSSSFMGEFFGILFNDVIGPLLVLILLPFVIVYCGYRFVIWFYENELKKPELRNRA